MCFYCVSVCEYEGRFYENGEDFRPPGGGPCVQCTCKVKRTHTLGVKRAIVNTVYSNVNLHAKVNI